MENLKQIRKQKKMTQQEIASKLNITQSTYSGYESGKYEPSIEMLIKISQLLQTSIDKIVNNSKNNFSIDISDFNEIEQELIFDYIRTIKNASWSEIMYMHTKMIEEQIYKEEHPELMAAYQEHREMEREQNIAWIKKIMKEQKDNK